MNKRKCRILVALHYLELGGAESALLGLLQTHDPNRADLDVFLYDHRGELMQFIPLDKVNLLPKIPSYSMLERPLFELLKNGFFGLFWGRIKARFQAKRDNKNNTQGLDNISIFHYIAEGVSPFLPAICPEIEYDLAISFLLPHQYVLRKVRARKKIAWLHTDYSRVYVSDKELPVWAGYDNIAAISEDVGNSFCQRFPELSARIIPVENILSSAYIKKRAEAPFEGFDKDAISLLTIGRYCYPKKLEEIPNITELIRKKGINIKWYIIGYGDPIEEMKLVDSIRNVHMEQYVIMLGKKSNPYPYISACDVYIQPSRYEGKSITVREAQILGKPVIVTAYPTAASQINHGVDGFIVPLPIESCASAIADILDDTEALGRVSDFVRTQDFGNESEIEKIYNLAMI